MARAKSGRERNDPRINISFYDDHLKFCREIAWRNRQSITAYVNSLIAKEMENYDRAEWDKTEGEIQNA